MSVTNYPAIAKAKTAGLLAPPFELFARCACRQWPARAHSSLAAGPPPPV